MKRLLVVCLLALVIPAQSQPRAPKSGDLPRHGGGLLTPPPPPADPFEWNGQFCDAGAQIEYTIVGRLLLAKPIDPPKCVDRPGWAVCNERRDVQIRAQRLALLERLQRVVDVCGQALGY